MMMSMISQASALQWEATNNDDNCDGKVIT